MDIKELEAAWKSAKEAADAARSVEYTALAFFEDEKERLRKEKYGNVGVQFTLIYGEEGACGLDFGPDVVFWPETGLHPVKQGEMIRRLVESGEKLVAVTHAEGFMRALQECVEHGELPPEAIRIVVVFHYEDELYHKDIPLDANGRLSCLWPGAYPDGCTAIRERVAGQ